MPFNKRNAIRQRNQTIELHHFVSTLKRVLALAEHKPLSPIRFVDKSIHNNMKVIAVVSLGGIKKGERQCFVCVYIYIYIRTIIIIRPMLLLASSRSANVGLVDGLFFFHLLQTNA
jgi:hypothetical protein